MKKILTIMVLALIASLARAQESITFEVDKDLPVPKTNLQKYNDKEIAKKIVNISAVPQELHRVVKTSFEGQRLSYIGDDNFYFIYTNIAAGCGIPSITLKGSPDDWQKVLDKVRSLKKYKLEKWGSDLEPILKEFVEASKAEITRFEFFFKGFKPVPAAKKESKKTKAVKAGKTISGTVGDEAGPLMGATVCEIEANGRIVVSGITDANGCFTLKVKNPEDRIRFSYVGMKTVTVPIATKKYQIKMEPSNTLIGPRIQKRQNGPSYLPIPLREVSDNVTKISIKDFEAIGLEPVPEKATSIDGLDIVVEEDGVPNENNPRGTIHLSEEEQAMVTSVNDLGFNMFCKVGAKNNILLSPMGMTYALSLISNGAGGETKKQINKVLGCDDAKAACINAFCRKMLTESSKLDKLTTIDITNEFFSPKGLKPKTTFTEIATDYYDTQFKEDAMLQAFSLTNTIHFKGIWTDKFRKYNTHDEVFKDEDGKETMVPMMNQTHKFYYTENDLCQTLCLPYGNGTYQMIVLLPKEGKTVQEVAQSLTADNWERSYDQMRKTMADVKLPRFESSSDVILTDVMKTLGMPIAFSMEKADFSNLFDIKSCIAKVKQTGRIEVDEKGTEATVVTGLQGRIAGLDIIPSDSVKFHATHPFLYFIREWSTSAIFFIGQYMGK